MTKRYALAFPSCGSFDFKNYGLAKKTLSSTRRTMYPPTQTFASSQIRAHQNITTLTILYGTQYNGGDRRCVVIDQVEVVKNMIQELRRGTLSLSVLSQLATPQYGYSLLECLTKKGVSIDQNTLYPLLRRLEQQGILDSAWSLDQPRPRRYYVLNDAGKSALAKVGAHWYETVAVMEQLLGSKGE
ncbi:MAG: PadR family transcriptional regulator [Kiritimatiellia bacterium]